MPILTLCLALFAGCERPAAPVRAGTHAGDYPIQAVATVGMVADLVRAVGGQHVEVQQLMGSGIDPHLYKPRRDDVAAILAADIVFYNGLMLEGKMAETLERSQSRQRNFAVAEAIKTDTLSIVAANSSDSGSTAHPDPHMWMSVELWRQAAAAIRDELQAFDPQHRHDYAENWRQLDNELERLHSYGRAILACIPAEQRVLVTSHDAFQYLGAAYGIEVQAVQGLSTDSEAGLNRVNQLVDMLVERQIRAVFVESSVPTESIEALVSGAAARGHEVSIAGTLYSDAMGPTDSYEGTYIGMMDHNFTSIARALGCDNVPPDGFRGTLQPGDQRGATTEAAATESAARE